MLDIMFPILKNETFDKIESFEFWFQVKLVLSGTNQLIKLHVTEQYK
jgi:hypothetical protein